MPMAYKRNHRGRATQKGIREDEPAARKIQDAISNSQLLPLRRPPWGFRAVFRRGGHPHPAPNAEMALCMQKEYSGAVEEEV